MSGALGTVEALSAADQASLADAVQKLEAYMAGPVATAIAKRFAFWHSLQASAAQYALEPASSLVTQVAPASIVTANSLADQNAMSYARLLAGLSSRQLKFAAWTPQGESSQPMQLGIVRADVNPGALGQWQVLPVVVRVVGQVAVAAGAWVLANAWTTSRELEAQAEKTRADTSAQISNTISAVSKQDPGQATALAAALAAAQKASNAATPGILAQLASSVQDVTSTVRDVGGAARDSSGALVLLAFLWVFMQGRRKNPSRNARRYQPRRLARSYAP